MFSLLVSWPASANSTQTCYKACSSQQHISQSLGVKTGNISHLRWTFKLQFALGWHVPSDPFPFVLMANIVILAEHWGKGFIILCFQADNTFHLSAQKSHFSSRAVGKLWGLFWYSLLGQVQSDISQFSLYSHSFLLLQQGFPCRAVLFFTFCRHPTYSQEVVIPHARYETCPSLVFPIACDTLIDSSTFFDLKQLQTFSTLKTLSSSAPAVFPNQSSQFIKVCSPEILIREVFFHLSFHLNWVSSSPLVLNNCQVPSTEWLNFMSGWSDCCLQYIEPNPDTFPLSSLFWHMFAVINGSLVYIRTKGLSLQFVVLFEIPLHERRYTNTLLFYLLFIKHKILLAIESLWKLDAIAVGIDLFPSIGVPRITQMSCAMKLMLWAQLFSKIK